MWLYNADFLKGERSRVEKCALWFLKLPHSDAKEQVIYNVHILRGFSIVLELLETIDNSCKIQYLRLSDFKCYKFITVIQKKKNGGPRTKLAGY